MRHADGSDWPSWHSATHLTLKGVTTTLAQAVDSKTSRSGRAWSCQSDFERQDASLTTGPTGRPFGGTSVYGPRVKRDLVKSRERDFLNMLANSPRAVFSDFCVTNRHPVDVEAFCILSILYTCSITPLGNPIHVTLRPYFAYDTMSTYNTAIGSQNLQSG